MNLETRYLISAEVVKRGLFRPKIVEITITDGEDDWTFTTAETFTISELKTRFPYFNIGEKS